MVDDSDDSCLLHKQASSSIITWASPPTFNFNKLAIRWGKLVVQGVHHSLSSPLGKQSSMIVIHQCYEPQNSINNQFNG